MSMSKQHVKDTKEGFFKYLNTKRKTQANVGLQLNGGGAWQQGTQRAGFWNTFLALVFSAKTSSQGSLTQETWGKEFGRPSPGSGGLA